MELNKEAFILFMSALSEHVEKNSRPDFVSISFTRSRFPPTPELIAAVCHKGGSQTFRKKRLYRLGEKSHLCAVSRLEGPTLPKSHTPTHKYV